MDDYFVDTHKGWSILGTTYAGNTEPTYRGVNYDFEGAQNLEGNVTIRGAVETRGFTSIPLCRDEIDKSIKNGVKTVSIETFKD